MSEVWAGCSNLPQLLLLLFSCFWICVLFLERWSQLFIFTIFKSDRSSSMNMFVCMYFRMSVRHIFFIFKIWNLLNKKWEYFLWKSFITISRFCFYINLDLLQFHWISAILQKYEIFSIKKVIFCFECAILEFRT